jgi:hypothetical protein
MSAGGPIILAKDAMAATMGLTRLGRGQRSIPISTQQWPLPWRDCIDRSAPVSDAPVLPAEDHHAITLIFITSYRILIIYDSKNCASLPLSATSQNPAAVDRIGGSNLISEVMTSESRPKAVRMLVRRLNGLRSMAGLPNAGG